VCVGVYTKSKTSELSPLRRKLLRFAKQFPPPLRSKKFSNEIKGVFKSILVSQFSVDKCTIDPKNVQISLLELTKMQPN
jgi:hypothetical protein